MCSCTHPPTHPPNLAMHGSHIGRGHYPWVQSLRVMAFEDQKALLNNLFQTSIRSKGSTGLHLNTFSARELTLSHGNRPALTQLRWSFHLSPHDCPPTWLHLLQVPALSFSGRIEDEPHQIHKKYQMLIPLPAGCLTGCFNSNSCFYIRGWLEVKKFSISWERIYPYMLGRKCWLLQELRTGGSQKKRVFPNSQSQRLHGRGGAWF